MRRRDTIAKLKGDDARANERVKKTMMHSWSDRVQEWAGEEGVWRGSGGGPPVKHGNRRHRDPRDCLPAISCNTAVRGGHRHNGHGSPRNQPS